MTHVLMLQTKDNRRFFTMKKNLNLLAEFANTFGVDLSLVNVDTQVDLLDSQELVSAICDATYTASDSNHEVVEKITLTHNHRKRGRFLKNSMMIRNAIRQSLLSDEVVSLRDLKAEYEGLGLTSSCICNHYSQVRRELTEAGYSFVKVGAGKYKLG